VFRWWVRAVRASPLSLSNFLSLDPEKSVIVWAWVKYDEFVLR
jgi:hypothetical protein